MKIKKDSFVSGRPHFTDVENREEKRDLSKKSFMTGNPLLRKLAPSAPRSKVIEAIKWLAKQIFRPFTIDRPDKLKEPLPSLIRSKAEGGDLFSPITFSSLMEHYRKYLKTDQNCPASMSANFERLEKDFLMIQKIEIEAFKEKDFPSYQLKNSKSELMRKDFIEKTMNDLKNLKNGESHLFLLNRISTEDHSFDGDLFCHISKQGENYHVRIVGSSSSMQILNEKTFYIAGKEKVERELFFKDIPANDLLSSDWMKEFIEQWASLEGITTGKLKTYLVHLEKYKKAAGSLDDLTTKSKRSTKLFWNLVHVFFEQTNDKQPVSNLDKEEKRVRLRAELLSLCEVFQKHRNSLDASGVTYRQLQKALEEVSFNVLQAYQKGYLTRSDLSEICKELDTIKKALLEAKEKPINANFRKISVKPYIFPEATKDLFDVHVPHEVTVNQKTLVLPDRTKGVQPSQNLESLHKVRLINLVPYASINDKKQLIRELQDLKTAWKQPNLSDEERKEVQEQILKFFQDIPFDIFRSGGSASRTPSFWWSLDQTEAIELKNIIEELIKDITSKKEFLRTINQIEFESIFRSLLIFNFLYSLETGLLLSDAILAMKVETYHYLKFNPDTDLSDRIIGHEFLAHNFMQIHSNFLDEMTHIIEGLENYFNNSNNFLDPNIFFNFNNFFKPSFPLKILWRISGKYKRLDQLFLPSRMKFWLRPIHNPFLSALYTQAGSWIDNRVSSFQINNQKIKEHVGEKFGLMTPEAFQSDPEVVFSYFLNDLKQKITDLKNTDTDNEELMELENTALSSFSLGLNPNEQKRLLMNLRLNDPQVELLAFMRECPHLLRNPDIRNFFDALFFNGSLKKLFDGPNTSYTHDSLIISIPLQIQEEIKRLEEKLKGDLAHEPIQDLPLAQERLDTLLYFYEMHEKLRQIYLNQGQDIQNFENYQGSIKKWKEFAIEHQDFFLAAPYAARIYLRMLLSSKQVLAKDLVDVVLHYMIIYGAKANPANLDPTFEYKLKQHWKIIINRLEANPEDFGNPNWQVVLDQYCYMKNLPLDGSTWIHQGGLVFSNQKYKVNLRTFATSLLEDEGQVDYLPVEIIKDPKFQKEFKNYENQLIRVNKQVKDNHLIYSFTDASGLSCQIEESQGQRILYKKVNTADGKWLQSASLEELEVAAEKTIEKCFKILTTSDEPFLDRVKAALKLIEIFMRGMPPRLPSLFDHGLYIDPQNPLQGYSLNEKGEVLYKIYFKESISGLLIDHVIDQRDPLHESWQINHAGSVSGFDYLKEIENKEQTLLWSQKGELKKVELPRLGLTFNVIDNQLQCITDGLQGYRLKPHASLLEKQGFPYALILEHPDSKRPKKLIVTEADALQLHHKSLPAKAGRLATLKLFLEKFLMFFKGKLPEVFTRSIYKLNPIKQKISIAIFDLRPYTNEICEKEQGSIKEELELVKQAIKINQPILALKMLEKIPLDQASINQKTLRLLSDFISRDLIGTGAESALKFKLCLKIKANLKKYKRSTKSVRSFLNKQMLKHGKTLLAAGRRLPYEISLNDEERVQLGIIAKKIDPDFYQQHMQLYFIPENETVDLSSTLLQKQEDLFHPSVQAFKENRPPQEIASRIAKLEQELEPLKEKDEDFIYQVQRLPEGQEVNLLFTPEEVKDLFTEKKQKLTPLELPVHDSELNTYETQALKKFQKDLNTYCQDAEKHSRYQIKASSRALNKFLNGPLLGKKDHYEQQGAVLKQQIQAEILKSKHADEQLAIYANEQTIASFDELRLALAQGTLKELQDQKRLPSTLDLKKLQKDLGHYFDNLTRLNATDACIRLIHEIQAAGDQKNSEQWESLSTTLYRLLTMQRHYDSEGDPRLLIFEAQQFINFKALEGGLEQIDLLETLLKNPYVAMQAPTGAGKTSVFSVLRSLLKANGKNLVVQKVLPALYQQTYDKMRDVLGDLYGLAVYPLKFNLKMRLTTLETVKKGVDHRGKPLEITQEVSVFKGMYYEMLETIKHHGCILTDYKSFPLLEERFWKLGQDLLNKSINGENINQLDREHYTYLKKILQLLSTRADENMDEFDQPNRPIHKIQLDLGVGSHPLPPFLIEMSIEIYEYLLKDEQLGLAKNIQGDLSKSIRKESITKAAAHFAKNLASEAKVSEQKLLDYFLGKNEDVLPDLKDVHAELKDKLALCKDQFSIYLPLTLSYNRKSRYDRSDDHTRTVTCLNGKKQEAKFGTILEQVNYTIQDYLQGGIQACDLDEWIKIMKDQWDESETEATREVIKNQVKAILPTRTILEVFNSNNRDAILSEINGKAKKAIPFLKIRLYKLKTSGQVISMSPQNIVDMSHVVSGTSATMGAPEALHRQFKVDDKVNGQIRANMAMRLVRRALEKDKVIPYDPADPHSLIDKVKEHYPISAIIDGSGAFKNSSKQAAESLLTANPALQQIGYYENENIAYVGRSTGKMTKTGFFFDQAHTRGTDIGLTSDALALLTLSERDGICEYFQKEGRLRQDTQRYILSVSQYQESIQNIPDAIAKAIRQDSSIDAQDIFRKSKQEPEAIIRKAAKAKLLACETLEEFLEKFQLDGMHELFISSAEASYPHSGDYYKKHQHLRQENELPEKALNTHKNHMADLGRKLGLEEGVKVLDEVEYSEELIAKMPKYVASIHEEELEMEHEVEVECEEEEEVEQQLEIQMETEAQGTKAIGTYPMRLMNTLVHPLSRISKIPYNPKILLSDSFLPLSRSGTKSSYQRQLFDSSMYRVGIVYFQIESSYFSKPDITGVVIEDPLEDSDQFKSSHYPSQGFFYDTRTNKIILESLYPSGESKTIIQLDEFSLLLAQIKFFDGRTSDYTQDEITNLASWMKGQASVMREHFLNDILRNRYAEKQAFMGSQIDDLFNQLMPN